jgi:hypothetical protein
VLAEDAAGNTTPVYGPVTLPRLNADSVAGAATQQAAVQAALGARVHVYFQANGKRAHTSRYGQRVVIRGNLRDARKRPVVGARLDVYHVVNGTRRLVKTGLKSRAGGRITLILPMNIGTRRIQFAYRALRPGPITHSRTLRLTVRDRRGRLVTGPLGGRGPAY